MHPCHSRNKALSYFRGTGDRCHQRFFPKVSHVGLEAKLLPENIWKGVTQMLLSLSALEAQASGAVGGFLAHTLQLGCGLACFSESTAGWT